MSVTLPDVLKDTIVDDVISWGLFLTFIGWVLWRRAHPAMKALQNIADDLRGEPARPGVRARPGVMERMAALEETTQQIKASVQPNGGRSDYDVVLREVRTIGVQVTALGTVLDAVRGSVREHGDRLERLEGE